MDSLVKHSPDISTTNFQVLRFCFCFHISSAGQKIPVDHRYPTGYSEGELCLGKPFLPPFSMLSRQCFPQLGLPDSLGYCRVASSFPDRQTDYQSSEPPTRRIETAAFDGILHLPHSRLSYRCRAFKMVDRRRLG